MALLDRFRSRPTTISIPRSLVASGQVQDIGGPPSGSPQRRAQQTAPLWQFYRSVGELHHNVRYTADGMRRVRLVAAFLGPDDEPGPLYDEEGKPSEGVDERLAAVAREMVRGLRSRTGGQSRIMYRLGGLLSVPADCYLLGLDEMGPEGQILGRSFDVCSPSELRPKGGGGWERRKSPGARPEDLTPINPETGERRKPFILRIWRDDFEYSDVADSSVAALSEILEESVLLTRQVRAEALSRLMRGLFLLPDTIQMKTTEPVPEGMDPVSWAFISAASRAISEPGSAAAMVPLVARAKKDEIEAAKLVEFGAAASTDSILKRKEAIDRFAQGWDLPVEVTKGHQSTTFANAFAITEDLFRMRFEPILDVVEEPLTADYMWPALMLASGLNPVTDPVPPELRRYVVSHDASDLLVHPDREKAANIGYGNVRNPNFAISDAAWRRMNAIPEGDKPNEEEIARRLEWAAALGSSKGAPAEGDGQEPVDGIDKGPAVPSNGQSPNGELALRLHAAGDLAIERALDKIGNNLRAKVNGRDAGQAKRLASVPPRDVARQLGQASVSRLIGSDPLAAEFAALQRLAEHWTRDHLLSNPEALAKRVADLFRAKCQERLFSDAPLSLDEVKAVLG